MHWQARLILTLLTVAGALLFGLIGGWIGPLLKWWWLPILASLAFLFVLPSSPVNFSQEALQKDIHAYLAASQALEDLRPQIEDLQASIEEQGSLSLEQVQDIGARFEELRLPPEEHVRTLRELLFANYRRTLAAQTLLLLFIALGGALLAHQFALWFTR